MVPKPINLSCARRVGGVVEGCLRAGAGARCVAVGSAAEQAVAGRAVAKAFTPDLTRAGHRGCSTDAYPGSRLSGRRLAVGTDATATSQIRPGILDAMRTVAAVGRPDRLKAYKSS